MTILDFVTSLGGITITGVNRIYDSPPLSLNDADLPAQWIQKPRVTDDVSRTFSQHGQLWATLEAQLIVACKAVSQSVQESNWEDTIEMMDNAWAAMAGSGDLFVRGKVTYIINQGIVTVAGIDYWSIIVEVIGHG